MKITAFIIFVACMQVAARSEAQTVTMSKKDATLQSIFAEIRKQTGYDFFYEDNLLKDATRVSIKVKNAPLVEVLMLCFASQPFTYTITGTTIILKRGEPFTTNGKQVTATPLEFDTIPRVMLTGKVQLRDSNRVVLENVNAINRNTGQGTATNANGIFNLLARKGDVLDFSFVGLKSVLIRVNTTVNPLVVDLEKDIKEQEAVTVYNTGYQQTPKERATGSFEFVNKEELNRRVGSDILSRLEGVSNSVFFDRRTLQPSQNNIEANKIIIRGLSTLTTSIQAPLIILNNFPYDGDINNINPNDVESITILKDAAAASIWGAKAGNGVIVITTKEGKYNQPTRLVINTNINVIEQPDLFHYKRMSSSNFIDVETYLFGKGFYNATLSNTVMRPAVTPVIEILAKRRDGTISAADSAAQIDVLRDSDVRNDFEKYIYRNAVNQQYFLNLTGGAPKMNYALSGGLDRNLSNLHGDNYQRASLRFSGTIRPIEMLEVRYGIAYTNSKIENNSLGDINSISHYYRSTQRLYPYARIADDNGKSLALPHDYRIGYTDTAGNGKLLDWKYSPLDEMRNSNNAINLQDILLNIGVNYKLTSFLSASINYQYENSNGETRVFRNAHTYYTRNLINLFSQISGNSIIYKIPNAGILDDRISKLTSHIGRAQLTANKSFNEKHQIDAILGGEIKELINMSHSTRAFGYDEANLSFVSVDYITPFPQYGGRGDAQIPSNDSYNKTLDHLVSIYGNLAYSFNKRYIFSASARKDASNLFGIDFNNKWKPLWSVGAAWNISNEAFYNLKTLSNLRLRVTYGYQGNVNNSLSPNTILTYNSASSSIIQQPYAYVSRAADRSLGWESIRQVNIGLDFGIFNNRLSGSIEAYRKNSNNLIDFAIVDPTTGISSIAKNSSSIRTEGIDFSLKSINVNGKIKWQTDILLSLVKSKITDYKRSDLGRLLGGLTLGDGTQILPLKGKAAFGMYSLPFAGLDPTNGDPTGYSGKQVSKDYTALLNQSLDTANLIYHGSALPTIFGFLNNSLSYKAISVTANISFRLGYYFRKNTISYYSLFQNGETHSDFSRRWQKPGDELVTTIPSMTYPISTANRDNFYRSTSVNVLSGDHVRLNYVRISYDLGRNSLRRFPIENLQVYIYVSNLGIIWRANKEGLDPDYDRGNAAFPPPKSIAFGLNLTI